jgi:hypothetical protein
MQYVNLSPMAILELAEAATRADAQGKRLRIETGVDLRGPFIKWKVGEGAWSPPFREAEVDPYRDATPAVTEANAPTLNKSLRFLNG